MNIVEILLYTAAAFAVGTLLGPVVIPLMRRLKAGQTERDDGPKSHLKKQGTPTMGGIIFLVPIAAASAVFAIVSRRPEILVLTAGVIGFGIIGFIDDFLKVKKRSKDGLLPWQKMAALVVIATGIAFVMYFSGGDDMTVLRFDMFGKTASLDIGWGFIPYAVFVMLAATNSVNLTDGLDGLCSGISAIVFTMISCVAFTLNSEPGLQIFGFICAGSLLAFLLYNYNPARIFMGDTGSLALGGGIAAMTLMMRRPLLLVIGGLIFVIEAMSDIIQVGVFKLSGRKKRVFRMAPIHHHFELGGWSEKRVVWTFWAFALVCCIFTYLSICAVRTGNAGETALISFIRKG